MDASARDYGQAWINQVFDATPDRVTRRGSSFSDAQFCRSASRTTRPSGAGFHNLGFRLIAV